MQSTLSTQYGAVAKFLHWTIAAAVIAMLVIGWVMADMPNGTDKFVLFQWHKSIGLTILVLSLFRLGWRLSHKAPPLPAAMPEWEKFAARATHILFYILIIGMPLSGWAIVSTSRLGIPTRFFGLFSWPNLPILPGLADKEALNHLLGQGHGIAAYILAALAVLHAAAAHKHHWLDRDDVLTRMAPRPIANMLDRLRGMK